MQDHSKDNEDPQPQTASEASMSSDDATQGHTTPLDHAHAAMMADPEDTTARLRFYDRLADAELFLLLEQDAKGDTITLQVFPVDDAQYVIAFDREDRLAQFAGQAPYAAISGRLAAPLLSAQSLGLGLNLNVAPSSILLPPDAISWFSASIAQATDELSVGIREVRPPITIPQTLLTALDAKLSSATGLAQAAYLAVAEYDNQSQGHILAFVDTMPGAEQALATSINETLTFSGLEAATLDVIFVNSNDPVTASLSRVGLRFDLPGLPERPARTPPGSDPNKPPRLR